MGGEKMRWVRIEIEELISHLFFESAFFARTPQISLLGKRLNRKITPFLS
jgi:hypothetical protein